MLLRLSPAWQHQVAKRGRNGSVAGVWERLDPAQAQRRQLELQPAGAEAELEVWAGSAGAVGTGRRVVWLQEDLQEVEDLRMKTQPPK